MRRISAVGAITAILITAAAAWAAPPKPAPKAEPSKTPTREQIAQSLEQEQKTYLERMQVCTRLRAIALEKEDEKMMQEVDALEQQAFELYMKRTAPLKSLVEQVRAAEAHLEERSNNPTPAGSAANGGRTNRAPNGRPIAIKEK